MRILVIITLFLNIAFATAQSDSTVVTCSAENEEGLSKFNSITVKGNVSGKDTYVTTVSELTNEGEDVLFSGISQDKLYIEKNGQPYLICGQIPNRTDSYFLLEVNKTLKIVSSYRGLQNCAFIQMALFHGSAKTDQTGKVSCY